MAIYISDKLAPQSGNFPLIDSSSIIGGLWTVEKTTDEIPLKSLKEGMIAYIKDKKTYKKYVVNEFGSLEWLDFIVLSTTQNLPQDPPKLPETWPDTQVTIKDNKKGKLGNNLSDALTYLYDNLGLSSSEGGFSGTVKVYGNTFDGVNDVTGHLKDVNGITIQPVYDSNSKQIVKDGNITMNSLLDGDNHIGGDITTTHGTITAKEGIFNNLNTDYLTVNKSAHFFELVIDKIKSVGGSAIFTPANGFTVDLVETSSDGSEVRLLWKATDGSKSITNMWFAGDLALCQNFNQAKEGTNQEVDSKYYWVRVKAAGLLSDEEGNPTYNYIDLDPTQKDKDCTLNPEPGDEIVMLGHAYSDDEKALVNAKLSESDPNYLEQKELKARQSAIYIAAYKSLDRELQAPLFALYVGIDDFDLQKHRQSYFDAASSEFKGKFTIDTSDIKASVLSEVLEQLNTELFLPYLNDDGEWMVYYKDGKDGGAPGYYPSGIYAKGEKGDTVNGSDAEFYRILVNKDIAQVDASDKLSVGIIASLGHFKGDKFTTEENTTSRYLKLYKVTETINGTKVTTDTSLLAYTDAFNGFNVYNELNKAYAAAEDGVQTNYHSLKTNRIVGYRIELVDNDMIVDTVNIAVTYKPGVIFDIVDDRIETTISNKDGDFYKAVQSAKDLVEQYKTATKNWEDTAKDYENKYAAYQKGLDEEKTYYQDATATNEEIRDKWAEYKKSVDGYQQTVSDFQADVTDYKNATEGYKKAVEGYDKAVQLYKADVSKFEATADHFRSGLTRYNLSLFDTGTFFTLGKHEAAVGYNGKVTVTVNDNITVFQSTTTADPYGKVTIPSYLIPRSEAKRLLKFDWHTSAEKTETKEILIMLRLCHEDGKEVQVGIDKMPDGSLALNKDCFTSIYKGSLNYTTSTIQFEIPKGYYKVLVYVWDTTDFEIENLQLFVIDDSITSYIDQTALNLKLGVEDTYIDIQNGKIKLSDDTTIEGALKVESKQAIVLGPKDATKTYLQGDSIGSLSSLNFLAKSTKKAFSYYTDLYTGGTSSSTATRLYKPVETSKFFTIENSAREDGLFPAGSVIKVNSWDVYIGVWEGRLTEFHMDLLINGLNVSNATSLQSGVPNNGAITLKSDNRINISTTISFVIDAGTTSNPRRINEKNCPVRLTLDIETPNGIAYSKLGNDGLVMNFGTNSALYQGPDGVEFDYGVTGFRLLKDSLLPLVRYEATNVSQSGIYASYKTTGGWRNKNCKQVKTITSSGVVQVTNTDEVIYITNATDGIYIVFPKIDDSIMGQTVYIKNISGKTAYACGYNIKSLTKSNYTDTNSYASAILSPDSTGVYQKESIQGSYSLMFIAMGGVWTWFRCN